MSLTSSSFQLDCKHPHTLGTDPPKPNWGLESMKTEKNGRKKAEKQKKGKKREEKRKKKKEEGGKEEKERGNRGREKERESRNVGRSNR